MDDEGFRRQGKGWGYLRRQGRGSGHLSPGALAAEFFVQGFSLFVRRHTKGFFGRERTRLLSALMLANALPCFKRKKEVLVCFAQ
jgi:hypothetical protein